MTTDRVITPRDHILDVAAKLFATKGIASTTVREIGSAAGVHSGSLYHHFASKDAMAVEVLTAFVTDLDDQLERIAGSEEPAIARLKLMMQSTLRTIRAHPDATTIVFHDYQYLEDRDLMSGLGPTLRSLRIRWDAVVAAGAADGTLRADVPADIASRIIRDALWATSGWPARTRGDDDRLADYFVEVFIHGLSATGRTDAV